MINDTPIKNRIEKQFMFEFAKGVQGELTYEERSLIEGYINQTQESIKRMQEIIDTIKKLIQE